jgi:hypothetical protein
MNSAIHVIWQNLFLICLAILAGLFICGLILDNWLQKRRERQMLAFREMLKAQAAGQQTTLAFPINKPFRIFQWKFVLGCVVLASVLIVLFSGRKAHLNAVMTGNRSMGHKVQTASKQGNLPGNSNLAGSTNSASLSQGSPTNKNSSDSILISKVPDSSNSAPANNDLMNDDNPAWNASPSRLPKPDSNPQ